VIKRKAREVLGKGKNKEGTADGDLASAGGPGTKQINKERARQCSYGGGLKGEERRKLDHTRNSNGGKLGKIGDRRLIRGPCRDKKSHCYLIEREGIRCPGEEQRKTCRIRKEGEGQRKKGNQDGNEDCVDPKKKLRLA